MNKFSSSLKKGFTLIEILIVIALLGVLAVSLLATIDPLEQIRKGQDSKTVSITTEVNGAFDRYYTTRQEYPWLAVAGTSALSAAPGSTYVTAVVTSGELKTTFQATAGTTLASIFVTTGGATKILCFQPTSKGMRSDKNTVYLTNAGGAPSATCQGASPPGAVTTCYWCISS